MKTAGKYNSFFFVTILQNTQYVMRATHCSELFPLGDGQNGEYYLLPEKFQCTMVKIYCYFNYTNKGEEFLTFKNSFTNFTGRAKKCEKGNVLKYKKLKIDLKVGWWYW